MIKINLKREPSTKPLGEKIVGKPALLGTLLSLPWLALGALALLSVSDSSIALDSLRYGLLKTVVCVVLAWFADRSLFYFSPPQPAADAGHYIPQLRRALLFLGICLLMQLV